MSAAIADILGLAALLGIGLALFWGACVAYTAWALTHPRRRTYAVAVSRGQEGNPGELPEARAFEERVVRVLGREVSVWDIEGDAPGGPGIIATPGWSDSKIGVLARLDALAPHARRIIAWDPPGHGDSPGACTLGTREVDLVLALMDEVSAGEPVVLCGWSLGAGVSVAAAARESGRVAAVIAEAPYCLATTPAREVMRARGLPTAFNLRPAFWVLGTLFGVGPVWRGFDRAQLSMNARCPVLVIHGTNDPVCPIRDGRAIAGAGKRGELVEIHGAGHNDLWTDPAFASECTGRVRAFLSRVNTGGSDAPTPPATIRA